MYVYILNYILLYIMFVYKYALPAYKRRHREAEDRNFQMYLEGLKKYCKFSENNPSFPESF